MSRLLRSEDQLNYKFLGRHGVEGFVDSACSEIHRARLSGDFPLDQEQLFICVSRPAARLIRSEGESRVGAVRSYYTPTGGR